MWRPYIFTVESGQISKSLAPYLNTEMHRQNVYMNIVPMTPIKSKTTRGRSIQGMVKAGFVKFDKEASWYPDLENELMTISDTGPRGAHDDMFDAFAYIGLTVDQYFSAQSDAEIEEEEHQDLLESYYREGVCKTTGY